MEDPAQWMEGGAQTVHQHREVGGRHRRRGDDRGAARLRRREGVGVPEEDAVAGRHRVVRSTVGQTGIGRVVRHGHHVRPRPRFEGRPDRPAQRRSGIAEDRQNVTGPHGDQPGAVLVVAHRQCDGDVGVEGVDVVQPGVLHPPGGAAGTRGEAARGVEVGLRQPKGDPRRPHADGAHHGRGRTGALVHHAPEEAIRLLEGRQRRHAVEAVEQRRSVDRRLRKQRELVEVVPEPVQPALPPGTTGQRGAGQRAQAERHQLGQMRRQLAPRLAPRRRAGRRRTTAIAVVGQAQVPAGPDVVGVDEARADGHVAAEVEGGDRRPIRAVTQASVGDRPQGVAWSYDIARRGHGRG